LEQLKKWLQCFFHMLENENEDKKEYIKTILEQCGKACAQVCGIDKVIHDIKKIITPHTSLEEIIEHINDVGLWDGTLLVEGSRITGYYKECCCPIRKAGYVSSPLFCYCTKGWTKAIFENILERDVEVTLEQTIAAGSDVCRIVVTL
jgi:predicted hydrocarbon binding protein